MLRKRGEKCILSIPILTNEGAVVFALALLHAQSHFVVQLDKAAVALPRKALVVGRGGRQRTVSSWRPRWGTG